MMIWEYLFARGGETATCALIGTIKEKFEEVA